MTEKRNEVYSSAEFVTQTHCARFCHFQTCPVRDFGLFHEITDGNLFTEFLLDASRTLQQLLTIFALYFVSACFLTDGRL